MVSTFSAECGLVMGQLACEEKSNEIMFFEEYRKPGISPDCCAVSHSQGHGRYGNRTCYISEETGWLEGRKKWSGLTGIGVIFCKAEQAGQVSKQAHYFIYSRKGMTASRVLEAKRSHWGIENQLHWVLDMQLREDESRARAETSVRGSFSDKQFKCLLDEAFLDKIIRLAFYS